MKLGLLGEKLSHSLSPTIHDMALKALDIEGSYDLIEMAPEAIFAFTQVLKAGAYDGINVTIPYKKEVIPYMDELSDGAMRIGAVNTILQDHHTLKGYNTDYDGFGALLQANFVDVKDEAFVVLGAGGAANGVLTYLDDHGAKSLTLITRNTKQAKKFFLGRTFKAQFKINGYHALNLADKILINTTPVGMYPNVDDSPVPAEVLKGCKTVVDLIYNPSETKLMLDAKAHGVSAVNGLYMLVGQALKSQEIWQGREIKSCLTRCIYNRLCDEKPNMVIIGMPGSGKTTVGSMLAERLDMDFFDMDDYIEKHYGDIPILFNQGEDVFRKIESEVIRVAAARKNTVICTGGGVVKRGENMKNLASTGSIFFLDRPLNQIYNDIDQQTRPLLRENKMAVIKLYDERIKLYRTYAHCRIENEKDAKTAVNRIMEKWLGKR